MKKDFFINIIKEIRNDTDYDLLPNKFSIHDKLQFRCIKHNVIYEQNVSSHKDNRCGCILCKNGLPRKKTLSQDEVIKRIKNVWGEKYDLSKVRYINARKKITIICKEHGEFKIKLFDLLNLHECPKCKQNSRLETLIEKKLNTNAIEHFNQYKENWLQFSPKSYLTLDFYLPQKRIAIECQGKQHFGFGGWTHNKEKRKNSFDTTKLRDQRKKQLCKEHGIKLVYFLEKKYEKYMEEDDIYFTNVNDLLEYIKKGE